MYVNPGLGPGSIYLLFYINTFNSFLNHIVLTFFSTTSSTISDNDVVVLESDVGAGGSGIFSPLAVAFEVKY